MSTLYGLNRTVFMSRRKLTWDGDDWNTLIGHHTWRAAVLHIEMSSLETPPNTHREGESVRKRAH